MSELYTVTSRRQLNFTQLVADEEGGRKHRQNVYKVDKCRERQQIFLASTCGKIKAPEDKVNGK